LSPFAVGGGNHISAVEVSDRDHRGFPRCTVGVSRIEVIRDEGEEVVLVAGVHKPGFSGENLDGLGLGMHKFILDALEVAEIRDSEVGNMADGQMNDAGEPRTLFPGGVDMDDISTVAEDRSPHLIGTSPAWNPWGPLVFFETNFKPVLDGYGGGRLSHDSPKGSGCSPIRRSTGELNPPGSKKLRGGGLSPSVAPLSPLRSWRLLWDAAAARTRTRPRKQTLATRLLRVSGLREQLLGCRSLNDSPVERGCVNDVPTLPGRVALDGELNGHPR